MGRQADNKQVDRRRDKTKYESNKDNTIQVKKSKQNKQVVLTTKQHKQTHGTGPTWAHPLMLSTTGPATQIKKVKPSPRGCALTFSQSEWGVDPVTSLNRFRV